MDLKLLLCIGFVFASASAGCSSEKSKWIGSGPIQQLEGEDGGSREQNWKACGVKCTKNRACKFWEFKPTTGWCWNFKIYGKSSGQKIVPAVGKHITGRSGCPQKECFSENTRWSSGYQRLPYGDGAGYEKNWEACGTKCTNNKDCDMWSFEPKGPHTVCNAEGCNGWCRNFFERGIAQTTIGNRITGRSGCP